MLDVVTVNHLKSSLDWSTKLLTCMWKDASWIWRPFLSLWRPLCVNPFNSLPVKATRKSDWLCLWGILKIMYLIFTVMMSILFLSVLVSQHVNLDALLIAERWYDFYRCVFLNRSRRLGHIVWHWCNCMEMAVCSTSCYLFKCYGNITLLAISV